MSTAIIKSLPIQGCAVYEMKDGAQVGTLPLLDSVSITLPSIEFETTTIPLMGSYDVPDFTRLQNAQLTINAPVDNANTRKLAQLGIIEVKITWVSMEYSIQTGETVPRGWVVIVKGHVSNIPNAEVSVGGENTADININILSISKRSNEASPIEAFYIDRSTGTVRVNGKDYTTQINRLF